MSYARIAQRLTSSIWLITQEGGDLLLEIFERRIANDKLTDEEIAIRLEQAGGHGSGDTDRPYSVDSGVATLGIYGPIFGKANLMTQMSGATSMEQFRNDF